MKKKTAVILALILTLAFALNLCSVYASSKYKEVPSAPVQQPAEGEPEKEESANEPEKEEPAADPAEITDAEPAGKTDAASESSDNIATASVIGNGGTLAIVVVAVAVAASAIYFSAKRKKQ